MILINHYCQRQPQPRFIVSTQYQSHFNCLWGRVFANIDMFEKVCKIQRTFLFFVLPLPGLVVLCTALVIVNCMI